MNFDTEPEVYPLPGDEGLSVQQLREIESELELTDSQKWIEMKNVEDARAEVQVRTVRTVLTARWISCCQQVYQQILDGSTVFQWCLGGRG